MYLKRSFRNFLIKLIELSGLSGRAWINRKINTQRNVFAFASYSARCVWIIDDKTWPQTKYPCEYPKVNPTFLLTAIIHHNHSPHYPLNGSAFTKFSLYFRLPHGVSFCGCTPACFSLCMCICVCVQRCRRMIALILCDMHYDGRKYSKDKQFYIEHEFGKTQAALEISWIFLYR